MRVLAYAWAEIGWAGSRIAAPRAGRSRSGRFGEAGRCSTLYDPATAELSVSLRPEVYGGKTQVRSTASLRVAACIVPLVAVFLGAGVDSASATTIHEVQGAAHRSPLVGTNVTGVEGIVTAKRTGVSPRGFYMQDPAPDGNSATSEGIFVFTSTAPTVNVGD